METNVVSDMEVVSSVTDDLQYRQHNVESLGQMSRCVFAQHSQHTGTTCNSILLPCLHAACSVECMERYVETSGGNYKCPACHGKFDKDKIQPNAILRKLAGNGIQYCGICIRQGEAEAWCSQCQKFLCGMCREGHNQFIATYNHKCRGIDDGKLVLQANAEANKAKICETHGNEQPGICLNCKEFVCLVCGGLEIQHEDHLIQNGNRYIQDFRAKGAETCKKLKEFLDKIPDLRKELDMNAEKIHQTLTGDLSFIMKRLNEAIEKGKNKLISDGIPAAIQNQILENNMKKEQIESVGKQAEQYMDYVSHLLNTNSSTILATQGPVKQQIENLYKQTKAIDDDEDKEVQLYINYLGLEEFKKALNKLTLVDIKKGKDDDAKK